MREDGDIWVNTRRKIALFGNQNIVDLENFVQLKFSGGHPVLFTSARAGMFLLFKNFHRHSEISIFPYASQCVVKAGMLAGKAVNTPLPNNPSHIIYNQWGVMNNTKTNLEIFLEDSADSFYPEGGTVCKKNSRFEVWSLSKSLGLSFGGVVWCRDLDDAQKLRGIRYEYPHQSFFVEFMLGKLKRNFPFINSIWEKNEFSHPKLNSFQIRSLRREFELWNQIYSQRKELFIDSYLKIKLGNRLEALTVLEANSGVIPTVIECEKLGKNKRFKQLHKIYPDGTTKKIPVFAYQRKVRC